MRYLLSFIFISFLVVSSLHSPLVVEAQTATPGQITYVPLEPLTVNGQQLPQSGAPSEFPKLLQGLFRLLLGMGALFAVGSFVYGGIVYMTSEIVDNKAKAIKRIQSAMWGLLLLLGSWLILNTINPQLLSLELSGNSTARFASAPAGGEYRKNLCPDNSNTICPQGNPAGAQTRDAAETICRAPVGTQGGFDGVVVPGRRCDGQTINGVLPSGSASSNVAYWVAQKIMAGGLVGQFAGITLAALTTLVATNGATGDCVNISNGNVAGSSCMYNVRLLNP